MRQLTISDGRASLRVSELCLGTMYFGYRTDEAAAFAILDRFLEAGGTFLDTANNYGQWHGEAGESERVIGRWMRSRGVVGTMVVATKVGARTTVPGDPDPRHWQGLAAQVIREDAETSLRNLGVDRLDLYYAHIERLTLFAYSPLLAGAYAHLDRSVPAAYQHAANHARLATLRDVAAEHLATANQVVLAWLLHRQPAIIPVPGASSVAQLDEILAATELKLNAEDLDRLDTAGRFAN
jgi:aryl-alcohol dehydrogenase-like predicted oxidoreductase